MAAPIDEFVKAVEAIAPLGLAYEWDNSGLLLRCSEEVKRVLIALDVTDDIAEEAARENCDMILAHHPLIFEPLRSISVKRASDAVLMKLVRNGISLYAAHTSYDRAEGGMGDALASKLDLRDVETIQGAGEGLMRIGSLEKPLNKHDFLEFVKKALHADALRISRTEIGTVKKAAVIGGSGGEFIEAAIEAGADALVTGEVKHHHFIEAGHKGLLLVEAGHYETELCFTGQVFMSLQSSLNELQLNVELRKAKTAQSPYIYV